MTPTEALEKIRLAGLTQHRDVTRHFSMLERVAVGAKARQLPDLRNVEHWLNRAHHCRFQELLPVFPDRSIRILAIDPPYVYGDSTYGSRSARSLMCDSDDAASAVGLVTDLLRDWQPKLAPGGVVLLWQPWQALLPAIGRCDRNLSVVSRRAGDLGQGPAAAGEFRQPLQRAGGNSVGAASARRPIAQPRRQLARDDFAICAGQLSELGFGPSPRLSRSRWNCARCLFASTAGLVIWFSTHAVARAR